jgi:hypothetical protein
MSNARTPLSFASFAALASLATAVGFAAGCGGSNGSADGGLITGNPTGDLFGVNGDDGGGDAAANLPRCIVATKQCVASCSGNMSTTVSGTVYDPAGKNPLYGVVVYVPSVPPGALPAGTGCYTCQSLYQSGMPIAYAVTDAYGKFSLDGVPDGTNIPLVVQVGKWRMQYTMPTVTQCVDNPATAAAAKIAAPAVLRLPRNRSEGDIPNIAIATGGADSLECLLSRIGVDKAEYGAGAGGAGRIHIFKGDQGSDTTPAAPVASAALWASQAALMPFDITLLTCEGHETTAMNQQALYAYAQAGGRVFASHFHYAWLDSGPFGAQNLAKWETGTQSYNTDPNAEIETTLPNGAAFPRGVAMKTWLGNVGALTNGELHIVQARHNAVVSAANTPSTPWIVTDTSAKPPSETEYFSFDTPFGTAAGEQCGRVVYSDLHVGAASGDYGGYTDNIPGNAVVPSGCADNALSPQEKALEFMLFDLSGCITPPDQSAGGVPPVTK